MLISHVMKHTQHTQRGGKTAKLSETEALHPKNGFHAVLNKASTRAHTHLHIQLHTTAQRKVQIKLAESSLATDGLAWAPDYALPLECPGFAALHQTCAVQGNPLHQQVWHMSPPPPSTHGAHESETALKARTEERRANQSAPLCLQHDRTG